MMTPMVNPKILRKSCENCIIIALLIIHNFVAYFTFEIDQKVNLEFKINYVLNPGVSGVSLSVIPL